MTRVCVELEDELHKAVRKKAIDGGVPMKDFIVGVLERDVEKRGEEKCK